MSKQWGARFKGGTDNATEAFTESVSFDARLASWDIQGSMAHARMLGDQGIISKRDAAAIIRGLKAIGKEIAAGSFPFDPKLEDVHTNIEAALIKRIGEPGKRLHTGRSRNDQIALDMRLWTREQIDIITDLLREVQAALVAFAEAHLDVILPGSTHLQHAQPVLLAHHILAYFEMFARDRQRFAEVRGRVNVMPLGSAALAGTPHPIDRQRVARELGFQTISANSMDAVSDRDFLIEYCAAAAVTMMHLSRLSEELVLWSTPEFDFIEIGDDYTTGSSIMPQKKNPDVVELIRGKVGRVYGDLTALLTTMKGLPLTYNRDMQEDKEPVFDATDTLRACLTVTARMIPSITVNRAAVADAVRDGFLEATDLADYLVQKGLPFRAAHRVVGAIVRDCIERGRRLSDLTLADLKAYSAHFRSDAMGLLDPQALVRRRDNPGGTAPRRVRAALRKAKRLL